MKPLRERVEDHVRATICRACIYEKADGGCNLERMPCPILSRVDKIIEVVKSIDSNLMAPYVRKLREVVCSECGMQDKEGRCEMRIHSDCTLDNYFVLLVDLVDQELARERAAAGPPPA